MDDRDIANFIVPSVELPKQCVGGYYLGGRLGLGIMFPKKPIWIHRFLMKLLLGWEWIDD